MKRNLKFNPKQYQGKQRIYTAVPRAPRITRLWIWDESKGEYLSPPHGKCYLARRYQADSKGKRKREYQFFASVDGAREWQLGGEPKALLSVAAEPEPKKSGPTLRQVIQEWKRRSFARIKLSTQISYEKLIRLYFGDLMDCTIYEITPQKIDEWFEKLRDEKSWTMKSKKRTTFKNEYKLLVTILNYYAEYHDDDADFRFPMKRRHQKATKLNRRKSRSKDIQESEFLRFREALQNLYLSEEYKAQGDLLAAMATVQYYQALRISEVAALHWEDVSLNSESPSDSRVKVLRLVVWPRKKDIPSFVTDGFKNADSNDGLKEHPLFPEAFQAFGQLYAKGAKGLIFNIEGSHLEYRTIQSAYDRAFKKAGLPYRGTHVMRHGGCRRIYNEAGDLAVAQQLLGNSDLKSTLVYAKRHVQALTQVAQRHWEKKKGEIGCKWLQSEGAMEAVK